MSLIAKFRWALERRIRSGTGRACYRIGGRWLTVHHRGTRPDLGVLQQCLIDRQYEIPQTRASYRSHVQEFYRSAVAARKIPLIVDCGANIGASVLWFAATYPEARIVALEPAADNLIMLRRNCDFPAADIRAAAIGASDGVTFLRDPGEGAWGYRTGDDATGRYAVPVLSIAKILAEMPGEDYEPFILKVDIEGAERGLFAEGWESLDRFPVIAIEVHDWMLPGEGTAHNFFRFHARTGRDFAYRVENVFSISYRRLLENGHDSVASNRARR